MERVGVLVRLHRQKGEKQKDAQVVVTSVMVRVVAVAAATAALLMFLVLFFLFMLIMFVWVMMTGSGCDVVADASRLCRNSCNRTKWDQRVVEPDEYVSPPR
eukprot:6195417-Pleurochrysis_carterae.AAC.3